MKNRKATFRFTLLALTLLTSWAYSQQVTFNRVSPGAGTLMGLVTGITQDPQGYMWFSAQGLHRYDGYHWRSYINDPLNPNSLVSNRLETVYADKQGVIWIGTFGEGMDRFDAEKGIFTHYKHNKNDPQSLSNNIITCIIEDPKGDLWIGTHGGLNKLNKKTGTFTRYLHNSRDKNSLSNDQVRELFIDRKGTLWVGTGSPFEADGGILGNGGLNRFNPETGNFTRYLHDPKKPNSLFHNSIRAIMEDKEGRLWVGTGGNGIQILTDPTKGTFERRHYFSSQQEKLGRPIVQEGGFEDHITFLHQDATGNIWIGSFLSGLYMIDAKSKKTTFFNPTSYMLSGAGEPGPWQIFSSREGVVWISTWDGQLIRVDPFRRSIPHFSTNSPVFAFHQELNGELWVGTGNGLLRINSNGTRQRFLHEPNNPSSLIDNTVLALCKDSKGTLWIATRFGLQSYDKKDKSFNRFQNNQENSNSISLGDIHKIYEDKKGNLWIGSTDGLNLMDRKTGQFKHFRNNSRDSNSISQNFITDIREDTEGNLWIGTWNTGGVNYFDRKTSKFKHFLPGASVITIFQDKRGTIWAGTEDGLYQYGNGAKNFVRFIDSSTGHGPVNIASILEDKEENLWVSTLAGILKISKNRDETQNFGINHGVKASNLNYLAGYEGPNDQIFLGDVTGYYVLNPNEVLSNSKPPQVVLTEFSLADRPVIPGKGKILTSPLMQAREIRLKHNQNIFSFSFAGIHYSSPEYNRHIYMLENYDHTWRQSGAERTAYYFNVPPGNYTFRVKTSSSDGIWAEKSIAIIISPPWWLTWWAYVLYALLLLGLFYLVHRIQRMRVIQKERERIREHELSQAREIERAYHELKRTQEQLIHSEKMASLGELTAGIAHEIQNPLNFVNNFSEVSVELIDDMEKEIAQGDKVDAVAIAVGLKENLKKIINHGKRADSIVKGMLQHTRGSTGEKQLTDINFLAEEYLRLSYHGMRAKDVSFSAVLETHLDQSIGKVNVIPQDLGRVLLNLFNNAFYSVLQKKHHISSGYNPTVSVSTARVDEKVEIRIKDNGLGIPKKLTDKIFRPFFTTKPVGQGTGLGLSLSYDIITKGHGGEMKVESKEGEYAEFILIIPNSKE